MDTTTKYPLFVASYPFNSYGPVNDFFIEIIENLNPQIKRLLQITHIVSCVLYRYYLIAYFQHFMAIFSFNITHFLHICI